MLNYMALAGYDADTAIAQLPNVLNLAAAGNMDLARASDLVTDAQSALGLDLDETNTLMDQWARTASKSNTSVEQLGEATLSVGATARDLNGGITELNTALGILADVGIKGSEGGIKLRNVMQSLVPTGDKAAAAWDKLGVSATDANGDLRPLEDTFRDLATAMDGLSYKDRTELLSAMFNKTDLKAVNAYLAAAGDEISAISVKLEDAEISWDKYMDAVIARTGDADMTVTDFTNDIADSINTMVEAGISGADQISYLQEEFGLSAEDAAEAIRASTTVIGDSVSKISIALQDSEIAWDDMVAEAQDRLGDLSISTEDITEDIAGYITAIKDMGLSDAEAIAELADQIGVTEEQAAQFFEIADSALSGNIDRWDELSAAIEDSEGAMKSMVEVMLDNLSGDIKIFNSALEGLQNTIGGSLTEAVRSFVQEGTEALGRLDAAFQSGGWSGLLDEFMNILGELTTRLTAAIPQIVAIAQSMISQFLSTIQSQMPNLIAAADAILQGIVGAFNQLIPQLMNIVSQGIPTFINYFLTFKEQMFSIGLQFITAIAEGIGNNIDNILESAQNIILRLADGIVQNANRLSDAAVKIIDGLVNFFTNSSNLNALINSALQIIMALANGLIQALPRLVEGAVQIITSLATALTQPDMLGKIIQSALQLILALNQGISNAIPKLIQSVPYIIENLSTAFIQNIPTILRIGIQIAMAIGQGLVQSSVELVKAAAQLILDIGNAFLHPIDTIKKLFGKGGQEAGEEMINNVDSTIQIGAGRVESGMANTWNGVGREMVTGMGGGFDSNISSLYNDVSNQMTDVGEGMVEGAAHGFDSNISSLYNDVSNQMTDVGKGMADGTNKGFDSNIGNVGNNMSKSLSNVGSDAGGDTIDALAKGMTSNVSTADKAASTTIQSVEKTLASENSNFVKIGTTYDQSIAQGMTNTASSIVTAAKNAIEQVIKALNALQSSFVNIGKAMAQGVLQGWNKTYPSIESKVKSQMQSLVSSVKSAMEIHSPSRVFADIGKNMALGLGVGWSDTIDDVNDDIVDDLDYAAPYVGFGNGVDDTVETYTIDTDSVTAKADGSGLTSATEYSTIININIDGANISDSREMAETIAEKLQSLVDRRQAVWA